VRLSNGKGLSYKILKQKKLGDKRQLTLKDPHTGNSFQLLGVDEAFLKLTGFKVVK